jgi:phosphoglucomutase
VADILADHWRSYGRNYYSRHDYDVLPVDVANGIVESLRTRLDDLPGQEIQGMIVSAADDFAYTDPIDASVSRQQGLRIIFTDGSRFVIRLSGTGTDGATLRLYLERYVPGPEDLDLDVQEALAPVLAAAEALAGIRAKTGRDGPDVVT